MFVWQVLKTVVFAKQVFFDLVFSQNVVLNDLVQKALKILIWLASTQCCGGWCAGHHGGANHCCRWAHLGEKRHSGLADSQPHVSSHWSAFVPYLPGV